jgi:hypothetical protein
MNNSFYLCFLISQVKNAIVNNKLIFANKTKDDIKGGI